MKKFVRKSKMDLGFGLKQEVQEVCQHTEPCQHTDWTREDVEKYLKKEWYPNWYKNTKAKSKYEAMGILKEK